MGILTLNAKEQLAADTMQALKASRKSSRSQPLTKGSSEGTDVSPGVPDESTVILTTSSEGTEEESEYPEEETADEEVEWLYSDEEEDKKDNDEDDRSIDIEKTDDGEETDDEFVHGDEYVHDDVDKEMKDVEVVVTGKDDQEITDAEKAEVEKTEEVKGDNKKAELPPTSSSLSVSFGFGNQFLAHSSDISLTGTLKDTADAEINSLLDIQIQQEVPRIHSPSILTVPVLVILEPTILLLISEIPIVTSATTHPPPHSVSTITPVLQQTTTPIPTPPITTEAPPVTTVPDPLHAIAQRVYVLEKDVQELKQVDYSVVLVESIRSQVPSVVKEYIGSSLGDALQKTKQETTAKENIPKFSATPYDQAAEDEDGLDRMFPEQPKQKKRDHGDDKDEDPSAGPNQGKKTKRRRTKEFELSKKSSTSKGNSSPKTSKSDKHVHAEESVVVPTHEVIMDAAIDDVVIDNDQPQDDSEQPLMPPTLDPEWNSRQVVDDQPEHPWFNDMVSAAKDPLTFDELMATPIDFSKFVMNRLKINKLTKAHLVGPVYNLLKGTCQSSIELEYNMEECYKALSDQLDWNNPERDRCPFDLSKPLPLKGHPEKKYTTSITKTKAARYELVSIEDMIPNLWSVTKVGYDKDAAFGIKHWGPKRQQFYRAQLNRFSKHNVFSHQKILSVERVKVDKLHGYGYLEEIVVRRADRQLYKFKEGDFVNLHLNDIEDMLLLVVQHKLFHLDGEVIVDLAVALRMFTRSLIIKKRVEDVQLGVES
ncbi:hypothetical protein Tco_1239724 [Tanacetum coccineum]